MQTTRIEKNSALYENALIADFLELITYDTKADGDSAAVPSSSGQLLLGKVVAAKLRDLGLNPQIEKTGVVRCTIAPSAGCEKVPHLALFAHLDTAGDFSGCNVKAHLVRRYDGSGLELANGLVTTHEICPELARHLGEDIITTDGTTLLGADDKAGVAVLLEIARACSAKETLVHGPLTLVFTVDEEIGLSVTHLDVKALGADVGLTVDGSELGDLDVETFNAALATVSFEGVSVHTSVAKDKLVNALKAAADFIELLPKEEAPETTEGLEGFYHPYEISGGTAQAVLKVLIRDFDKEHFKVRQDFIRSLASAVNEQWGREVCHVKIDFQYHNLKEYLEQSVEKSNGRLDIVAWCQEAYRKAGVAVRINRVRGGTDGSNLSAQGLPTPNIFTGSLACHGPHECLPVTSLLKSAQCVKNVVAVIASKEGSCAF